MAIASKNDGLSFYGKEAWEFWSSWIWVYDLRYRIIPYNPILKERARRLRKNMTLGERSLWQHLKGKQVLGYDFDRQRPIDWFIVDFYCKALMLAIEIDGSSHDGEEAQRRDRIRQRRLESFGIEFLRFSEGQARAKPEEIVVAIEAWINSRPTPSPSREGDV